MSNQVKPSDSRDEAEAGPSSNQATSPKFPRPTINLTTLDKIKRFFFSKEEWEAYLMEKMEEQEKKKDEGGDITLETKSDSMTKKNVVSWLKTVFPSQEDANSFLKSQIDKLQEDQATVPAITTSSSIDQQSSNDSSKR